MGLANKEHRREQFLAPGTCELQGSLTRFMVRVGGGEGHDYYLTIYILKAKRQRGCGREWRRYAQPIEALDGARWHIYSILGTWKHPGCSTLCSKNARLQLCSVIPLPSLEDTLQVPAHRPIRAIPNHPPVEPLRLAN